MKLCETKIDDSSQNTISVLCVSRIKRGRERWSFVRWAKLARRMGSPPCNTRHEGPDNDNPSYFEQVSIDLDNMEIKGAERATKNFVVLSPIL